MRDRDGWFYSLNQGSHDWEWWRRYQPALERATIYGNYDEAWNDCVEESSTQYHHTRKEQVINSHELMFARPDLVKTILKIMWQRRKYPRYGDEEY